MSEYKDRVKSQIRQYANMGALWKLPPICYYWMTTYIRPRLQEVMGCSHAREFYLKHINSVPGESLRILSIGSGDCNLEINLAKELKLSGKINFTIECLELSDIRLGRAQNAAKQQGVSENLVFTECDLNNWTPDRNYEVIFAHHSLHNIVELEHLFAAIKQALTKDGLFLNVDMIGRNGHMRWPEALEIIEGLWSIIPNHYKFNYQFNQFHEQYLNWDCSQRGFEGIRAQDILPLLVEHFSFQAFLGYGNIVDPFIERGYGHNLDPENPKDRKFVDFVEGLNTKLIDVGIIKPTTMFAVMGHQATETKYFRHWSPSYCIRNPGDIQTISEKTPAKILSNTKSCF